MLPHEDESKDMIKSILQKIIDEMDTLESDRIMPEHRKPKVVAAEIEVQAHKPEEMYEEEEDLDPNVLTDLMTKAEGADDTGALPEDMENGLPPEINDAVRRKKKLV